MTLEDGSPSELRALDQFSSLAGDSGWRLVQPSFPDAYQPDLTFSDDKGNVVCVEVKLGKSPLHSRIIRQLSAARDTISDLWPGNVLSCLLTTRPVSQRVRSAYASSGVVIYEGNSEAELERHFDDFLHIIAHAADETGPRLDPSQEVALALEKGHWDFALDGLWKIAKKQEVELGSSHPSTLSTRLKIAHALDNLDRFDDALEQLTYVERVRRTTLGANHRDTLNTRYLVALHHTLRDEPPASLHLLESLEADLVEAFGPEDLKVLDTRDHIAGQYSIGRNHERAIRLYESLENEQRRTLGSDDPRSIRTRRKIATETMFLGDSRAAEEQFRLVIADQTRTFGGDHPETLFTRSQLISALVASEDFDAALSEARQLEEDSIRVFGARSSSSFKARLRVGEILTSLRRHEDAQRTLGPLLEEAIQLSGANSDDVADVEFALASDLMFAGSTDEAKSHLRNALQAIDITTTIGLQRASIAKQQLALCLRISGASGEAVRLANEAYESLAGAIGEDDPSTASAAEFLRETRQIALNVEDEQSNE